MHVLIAPEPCVYHILPRANACRHAFATRQLEAGLPVHRLQRQLGHQDIHSTLRYVHWVPDPCERTQPVDLLGDMEVDHD